MITQRTYKRFPNAQEKLFIDALRAITHNQEYNSKDLVGHWKEEIVYMQEAYSEDGIAGFWKAYDALAVDHKQLAEWKDLVKVAPPQVPQEEIDSRFITTGDKKHLKLYSIDEIYETSDAEYLISKVIETATVGMLYGMSGTGKTFTALHMALSVAHGLYWHGRKTKAGPVWFVNTEGARGLKKRLKAWYMEHDQMKAAQNFHIIPWALDLKAYQEELENTLALAEVKPVLIVLDNFSMCAAISQNLQEEVAPILRNLNDIAGRYGCHIMLVHHTNKEGDFNGSMAFRNHVDVMIELKKEDKTDKESPIVFSCQKSRDDEPFQDIRTKLKSVNLSYDDETEEYVTSCVTTLCEAQEKENEIPTRESNNQVLDILKSNGQLNMSKWVSLCKEVHDISRRTVYSIKAELEAKGEIIALPGSISGKSKYFKAVETVTEKSQKAVQTGDLTLTPEKPVQAVQKAVQNTGCTGPKPVQPVSSPLRDDTGCTGQGQTGKNDTGQEDLEEPDDDFAFFLNTEYREE